MEQELQNQLDIKTDHLNEANKKNAQLREDIDKTDHRNSELIVDIQVITTQYTETNELLDKIVDKSINNEFGSCHTC